MQVNCALHKYFGQHKIHEIQEAASTLDDATNITQWKQPLTSDHLEDFLRKMSVAKVSAFDKYVKDETCFDILDCLHDDPKLQVCCVEVLPILTKMD